MANVIARVKLAPGETGFFDSSTNTYLNWSHPVADIELGSDLKSLRAAVKAKKITVIEGSLGQKKTFKQVLMEAKSKRTGQPLEELMGDTPLAFEPTEIIGSDNKADGKVAVTKTTLDIKPDKELVEQAVTESKVATETAKKTVKAADTKVEEDKKVEEASAVEPVEDKAKEPEEKAAPKKKTTSKKKSTKKVDEEAAVEAEEKADK